MTAETVYNILFGDPNGSKEVDIKTIKDYAHLMIEQDRERVKANVSLKMDYNPPIGLKYMISRNERYYMVDIESIDKTPIILT